MLSKERISRAPWGASPEFCGACCFVFQCVSYPRAVITGRSLEVVYASRVPLLYESLYHFVHLFVVFRSEVVPREKGLWFRGLPKVDQPPKLEV